MRSHILFFAPLLFSAASAQDPVLVLKLTDAFPVEMPELHPYALYAGATIDAPEQITDVVFTIDGTDVAGTLVNGAYEAWWTPGSYGLHTVSATATASNGHTATQAANVTVSNTIADRNVMTFDNAVIDWGTIGSQWYTGDYTLPQSVGAYDHITAHLSVSCPAVPGGCDDWDRLAYVEAQAPNGEWVEIIRYITPYGRACDHSIDVTDFASLLQGNTPIRMYIETWGTGGWKMDLEFTYTAGTPDHLYSNVQKVWHGNYNFGDPADLQPVDTVTLEPGAGVTAASLRVVTTGHGWGDNNTDNAAEFFHAVHTVFVNGQGFEQDLWTNCNPNPDGCSPQNGTWQYSRAGWCPGSIATPFTYDLTPLLGFGPLVMSYEFQSSYVDLCHPNNPDCISGTTCNDCNDGYNPYYPVSAYLIGHSNSPISLGIAEPAMERATNALHITPNPGVGCFMLRYDQDMGKCVVTVHNVSGETLRTWFFNTREQLEAFTFDITKLAKGAYFVKVEGRDARVAATLVLQ